MLGLLLLIYKLQTLSPLRLGADSIAYLSMAASAADGAGLLHQGHATRFPPGYSTALSLLEQLGVGTAFAFNALNLLSLVVGLACTYFVIRRAFASTAEVAVIPCILVLLSYVFVKHTPLAQSDLLYFGLSTSALLALVVAERLSGERFWGTLMVGAVLVIAAIAVRTIGVALVPAALFAILPRGRVASLVAQARFRRLLISLALTTILIGSAAVTVAILSENTYVLEAMSVYGALGNSAVAAILSLRLQELGELALNVPATRAPGVGRYFYWVGGLMVAAGIVRCFWTRRQRYGTVDVYLLFYLFVLLVWPYHDARFWLPVFPFVAAGLLLTFADIAKSRVARRVMAIYGAWFFLTGAAALAYSTRITFAGPAFPERFPIFPDTYALALNGCTLNASEVRSDVLHLLRRYEPRALHVDGVPLCDEGVMPTGDR